MADGALDQDRPRIIAQLHCPISLETVAAVESVLRAEFPTLQCHVEEDDPQIITLYVDSEPLSTEEELLDEPSLGASH